MLKNIFAAVLAVSLIFTATAAVAATPRNDTFVMSYGSLDIYVKAGSLYRTDGGGNYDAAPQFECDLINVNRQSGRTKTYHAKFIAKGMTVMQYEGRSDTSDFANSLYEAICRKLIF